MIKVLSFIEQEKLSLDFRLNIFPKVDVPEDSCRNNTGFDFIFRMMNLRNYKPLFIFRITNLCKCRNCETDFNFRMMNITSFSELRTSSQMILWRKNPACNQIDGGTVQLTMHVSLSADNSICLTWLSEPSIIYPVESITMQQKRTIDWSIKFVISITIFSYMKTKIRNQPSESHMRILPLINLARSLADDN